MVEGVCANVYMYRNKQNFLILIQGVGSLLTTTQIMLVQLLKYIA